jgi:hypothetical protein
MDNIAFKEIIDITLVKAVMKATDIKVSKTNIETMDTTIIMTFMDNIPTS